MTDYKKMYYELFNAITDSIAALQKAQVATEELYISTHEEDSHSTGKNEDSTTI